MDADGFTVAETVARCGLPESTLRYWERIGLMRPIERDARRYLELKVQYRGAREVGDLDKAAAVADELGPIIHRINPKDIA